MRKVSRLVFIFTSVEHNFLCLFSRATKHLSFPFHFSRSIPSFSERARDLSTIIANRHPIHSHVKRDDDGVAFTWALCHWFSCFCTKYEKPVSRVSLAPWHSETVNEQAQSGWNGWRAGSGLTGGASESVMRRWNNTYLRTDQYYAVVYFWRHVPWVPACVLVANHHLWAMKCVNAAQSLNLSIKSSIIFCCTLSDCDRSSSICCSHVITNVMYNVHK